MSDSPRSAWKSLKFNGEGHMSQKGFLKSRPPTLQHNGKARGFEWVLPEAAGQGRQPTSKGTQRSQRAGNCADAAEGPLST